MHSLSFIYSVLALATAGVNAAVVETRQANPATAFFASMQVARSAPVANPVASNLKPESFPSAKRDKLVWGPYKLAPANGKHVGTERALDKNSDMMELRLGGICKGCMIQSAKIDVSDKSGKKLTLKDKVYTHHINLLDSMNLFIGKGNEGDAAIFSPLNASSTVKSGFWFSPSSQPLIIAEVVNYKDTEQQVYLTLDYEYLTFPSKPTGWLDVSFQPIMTMDKMNLNLYPPKNRAITYTTSATMFGFRDGYIISLVPHLHDGGISMKILVNNEVKCESKAIYGTDDTDVGGEKWETIVAYEPCIGPIAVKKGSKVTLASEYDLRKHKLRPTSGMSGGSHGGAPHANNQGMEAEAMAVGLLRYSYGK